MTKKTDADLKSAYIIYGEEKWLVEQKVNEIRKKVFLGNEWSEEYNYTLLEGKNIGINALLENVNQVPFMATRRMVVLNGAEIFTFGGKNNEEQKKADKLLLDYLADPNPSCVLVIINNYLPEKKSSKTYAKFETLPAVEVIACEQLKPQGVKIWVKDYLAAYNISIDRDALEYLTAESSRSLGILANELEKAITYTGKNRLTLEDIKQIVTPTNEETMYRLFDFLVKKQSDQALSVLYNLFYYGQNEYQVLGFLERQYLRLLEVKEYYAEGLTIKEIMKKLNIPWEVMVKDFINQSRYYQKEQLEEILAMLLEAEMDLKTQPNSRERVERLLVELCNALKN